jgi:threonine synthase
MDIQVASNFERLYFESVDRVGEETERAFRAFTNREAIDIPPTALASMRKLFCGVSVSESETARTILSTLNETGELIDPHTAVAVAGARLAWPHDSPTPLVALATAHPAKFPLAVRAAAGVAPPTPRSVGALAARSERIDRLPAEVEAVKAYVRGFAGR